MVRKAVKFNTKANDTIEALMKNFKPRFGDNEDIAIIKNYGSIKKMLSEVDASEMRKLELKRLESSMTTKMKSIKMKESQLIFSIKNRKI